MNITKLQAEEIISTLGQLPAGQLIPGEQKPIGFLYVELLQLYIATNHQEEEKSLAENK